MLQYIHSNYIILQCEIFIVLYRSTNIVLHITYYNMQYIVAPLHRILIEVISKSSNYVQFQNFCGFTTFEITVWSDIFKCTCVRGEAG